MEFYINPWGALFGRTERKQAPVLPRTAVPTDHGNCGRAEPPVTKVRIFRTDSIDK